MRYIDLDELLKKKSSWGSTTDFWKDPKLKKDFEDFFFHKCWYTEKSLEGSDADIDHFRPKAMVKKYGKYDYNFEIKDKGYYWLRNNARNYRYSCEHANRKRGKGGKWEYFPLFKGSPHLTSAGTEKEDYVLLDPCVREDVNLLVFRGTDIEAASSDPKDKERVKVSIDLYNLHEHASRRAKLWANVKRTIDCYKNGSLTQEDCLTDLREFVSRETEYSACAIACVRSEAPNDIKIALSSELEL